VFPPIPLEVVLPLAGYLVRQGDFDFVRRSSPPRPGRRGSLGVCGAGAFAASAVSSRCRPGFCGCLGGRYVVLTIIGSSVWNAVLIGAGYVLGTQWERVADTLGPLATPALVLTLIAAAGLVLWR